MTPELAAGLIAYASQVWPWAELGDHAVEAWSDASPDIDATTAHTAMRRLAASLERPPSLARFLAEVRVIRREHAQPAIAAGPVPHSTRRQAAARIRALREAWAEASAGRPDHNHKRGDAACPRCSTTDEYLADHAVDIARVLRDHPVGDR